MKTDKIYFSDFGIFVCTKCQQTIQGPPGDLNPKIGLGTQIPENIKNSFKADLNEKGYKGKVRVMSSSCLGICPTGSQAIAQISTTDPSLNKSYIFNPFEETEEVFEEIKKTLPPA